MQTEQSQKIVRRFFEAIQILKANKIIRGKQTFTERYGINRWNFNTCEKSPERDIFQVAWIEYLVRDYKVSATWLITGNGSFFDLGWDTEKVKNLQKNCKRENNELQTIDIQ